MRRGPIASGIRCSTTETLVLSFSLVTRRAIYLDHNASGMAGEVSDVTSDDLLTPEVETVESISPQPGHSKRRLFPPELLR